MCEGENCGGVRWWLERMEGWGGWLVCVVFVVV